MAPAAHPSETFASAGEQARLSRWQVVGTAVMGISHERLGLPCQDAQGSRLLDDGTLLIAVADGAGSAQYSDQGARTAVDTALDSMAAWLRGNTRLEAEEALRLAFQEAREAVLSLPTQWRGDRQPAQGAYLPDGDAHEAYPFDDGSPDEEPLRSAPRQAEEPPLTARAFACTLTCVIAGARLVVGQIGDGAVVAAGPGEDDPLFTVTRLQRGEYANETHFLVQDDALERLIIDAVDEPVTKLAVMSDGLIRLALRMPSQEPHEPFFVPLFRFVASSADSGEAEGQLCAFLSSERVNARTDDDKSLVLAVRLTGETASAGSLDRAEE